MLNSIFAAFYFLGLIVETLIRVPHARRNKKNTILDNRMSWLEHLLLSLNFLSMFFLPLIYLTTPWLDSANYASFPNSVLILAGWGGVVVMIIAVWLFWRAHVDLGRNWSPLLQIREKHALITCGVYRHIRHPMYASQWLWGIAQLLLLQNWIAGPAGLLAFLPLYLVRVPREEQMMLEHFSDTYRNYLRRTGRVIPQGLIPLRSRRNDLSP